MFNKEEIIGLFKEIALPFKDKEGGLKADKIIEILNRDNIPCEYIPDKGIFVNKIKNPRIMILSHIDLIGKFRKGFMEDKVYNILDSEDPENKFQKEIITGALDNTITNAIAILVFKELYKVDKNIMLFLTEGEEIGSTGLKNYLKTKKKANNIFFINLDVTNEGWNQNGSIEYDRPNFYILNQLKNILVDKNIYFTGERVGDDIDAVNRFDCSGFSYCLPTKDTIHSYKNKALTETLVPYAEALYKMSLELKFEESFTRDISSYHVKKALKFDTKKDFEEDLNSSENYSRTKYSDNNSIKSHRGQRYFDWRYDDQDTYNPYSNDPLDFDFDKESESNSKINEILAFRNVDSDLIFSFIFEHLATLESFSYEDLDLLCRKYNKFGELELSLQLIQDFLNAELLVELSFRNYVFKL